MDPSRNKPSVSGQPKSNQNNVGKKKSIMKQNQSLESQYDANKTSELNAAGTSAASKSVNQNEAVSK